MEFRKGIIMDKNLVIGIEGEVASGKTSICKELKNIIDNSIFIDGGALYRGIIIAIKEAGYTQEDLLKLKNNKEFDVVDMMKKLNVELRIENKESVIYINNKKIEEDKIQTEQNSMNVTVVASSVDNTSIFKFANIVIAQYSKNYNIIVSARKLVDIYPNMDCHVFIKASLEERVKRRYNQYNGKYTMKK